MMIESPDQQSLDDFAALYVGHYEQLLRLAVLLAAYSGVTCGGLSSARGELQPRLPYAGARDGTAEPGAAGRTDRRHRVR